MSNKITIPAVFIYPVFFFFFIETLHAFPIIRQPFLNSSQHKQFTFASQDKSLSLLPTKNPKFIPIIHRFTHLKNNQDDTQNEWDGFNPFQQNKKKMSYYNIQQEKLTSFRKMKMSQLMNDLLQAASSSSSSSSSSSLGENKNNDAVDELLQQNRDFLLEPLDNDNAVLEDDSIYSPNMTRMERYQTFDKVMLERESKALNDNVKIILGRMRIFVMSCQ